MTARASSSNSTVTTRRHGVPDAVCRLRPALWASSRPSGSEVRPVNATAGPRCRARTRSACFRPRDSQSAISKPVRSVPPWAASVQTARIVEVSAGVAPRGARRNCVRVEGVASAGILQWLASRSSGVVKKPARLRSLRELRRASFDGQNPSEGWRPHSPRGLPLVGRLRPIQPHASAAA